MSNLSINFFQISIRVDVEGVSTLHNTRVKPWKNRLKKKGKSVKKKKKKKKRKKERKGNAKKKETDFLIRKKLERERKKEIDR